MVPERDNLVDDEDDSGHEQVDPEKSKNFIMLKQNTLGSGCGAVGRAVASDTI